MALYPITYFDPFQEATTPLLHGWLACGRFVLPPDETIRFRMVRSSDTQDNSLRCWISEFDGGASIALEPMESYWHLNRTATFEVVITSAQTPILNPLTTSYVINAQPGSYVLNVLNMVNSLNPFYVSTQMGELDD